MLANVPHVLSCDVTAAAAAAQEITAILFWAGTSEMVRQAFLQCRNVRWIHTRFAGVDNLLFPELLESTVVLTNGKGIYSAALGEFVLAAILYFAKDIPRLLRSQAAHEWTRFEMERIDGQTIGIVGYGDIGRAVAQRTRPMGMRVFATKKHAPEIPDPLVDRYYAPAELHQMLAICDYVVVAAPLTPETQRMIRDAEFAAMKRTAVLINVGRGPVVDTDALVRALNSGQIRGAGLDVVDPEPLPAGHPLYAMRNVLLSPHCADVVAGWKEDAMRFFLAQYDKFRSNQPLSNIVKKQIGY